MGNIFEYLKANYQLALVAFGIVIIIGSILRWNWLLNPSGKMKNSLICSVIIEKWGENGLRGLNIFFGILLIICGMVFFLVR